MCIANQWLLAESLGTVLAEPRKCGPWARASAESDSLLKMQRLGPIPETLNQREHPNKIPRGLGAQ